MGDDVEDGGDDDDEIEVIGAAAVLARGTFRWTDVFSTGTVGTGGSIATTPTNRNSGEEVVFSFLTADQTLPYVWDPEVGIAYTGSSSSVVASLALVFCAVLMLL